MVQHVLISLCLFSFFLPHAFGKYDWGSLQFIYANNTQLVNYNSVDTNCKQHPDSPECENKWWSDNDQSALKEWVQQAYSTRGPASSLNFAFSRSKRFLVGGKCEQQANCSARFDDSVVSLQQDRVLFNQSMDRDISDKHTFVMSTNGYGLLNFVWFAIDHDATAHPGSPASTPEPSSTSSSKSSTTSSGTANTALPSSSDEHVTSTALLSSSGVNPENSSPTSLTHPGSSSTSDPVITISSPNAITTSAPADEDISTGPTTTSDDPRQTLSSDAQPSSNPTALSPPPTKHKGNAAIAGAVVGVLVFVVAVLLAAWYIRRWIRARRAPSFFFRYRHPEFDIVVKRSPPQVYRESSVSSAWEPILASGEKA